MVLDAIKNDEFVFKNTYRNNDKVRVPVKSEKAPSEFYFVHIKLKETGNKTNQAKLSKKRHNQDSDPDDQPVFKKPQLRKK